MSYRWIPGPARSGSADGRGERGFTLLEALVALLVVGLAVLGAVEAASHALRVQGDALRRAEAAALADARLQELSLPSRDSLEAHGARSWEEIRLGPHRYRRRSSVFPSPERDGLWRATVEVAWADGSLQVETLLYRPRRDPVQGGAR